jgi:hypothetical protein
MKPDPEQLLSEALKLPEKARARMASRLLESLDRDEADNPATIEAAWDEEIARRKQELAKGTVKAMTVEESLRFIASDDPSDDSR